MTLSRWRRVVTGVAAGVIVLIAALIGASFRNDNAGVSIASELRPENVIPIEEDPIEQDPVDTGDDRIETTDEVAVDDEPAESQDGETDATADPADDDEDNAASAESASTETAEADEAEVDEADEALTDPVQVIEPDDIAADDEPAESQDDESGDTSGSVDDAPEEADTAPADTSADQTPPAQVPVETPAAPLPSTDSSLGTGGGVNDAECALDRLVIYAGARRGGVAGSIRSALAQAGFGAGCPAPVTVLASNCPLQFSGVLGAGSGYDPNKSFVAANPNVDRATMTAVLGEIGYSGNQIDILNFGFVTPDRPGERWMAVFIPPSFDGWQNLAARAGQAPTASSLCAPSGLLAG